MSGIGQRAGGRIPDQGGTGKLPISTPQSGQTGAPSASFSVDASRKQQKIMDEEDDFMEISIKELKRHIREAILENIVDEDEYEDDEEEEIDEFSAVGGGQIAGHMGGGAPTKPFVKKTKLGGK